MRSSTDFVVEVSDLAYQFFSGRLCGRERVDPFPNGVFKSFSATVGGHVPFERLFFVRVVEPYAGFE